MGGSAANINLRVTLTAGRSTKVTLKKFIKNIFWWNFLENLVKTSQNNTGVLRLGLKFGLYFGFYWKTPVFGLGFGKVEKGWFKGFQKDSSRSFQIFLVKWELMKFQRIFISNNEN